jgi:predicted transcriptional regulator
MSTKEIALASIQELPDTATWEEIEERVRFLAAIEKGRQDIRQGKIVPHQEVRRQLDQWLSK